MIATMGIIDFISIALGLYFIFNKSKYRIHYALLLSGFVIAKLIVGA